MNDPEELLHLVQQVTEEVGLLQMELAVQRSAYLLLVRRLRLPPLEMAADMESVGLAQTAPAWRRSHAAFARYLRLLQQLPPRRQTSQRAWTPSCLAPRRRALSG